MDEYFGDFYHDPPRITPHDKLIPFIRDYTCEHCFLQINFYKRPHYLTCRWLRMFFFDCFETAQLNRFLLISFTPSEDFEISSDPTLFDKLPHAARAIAIKNVPCFSYEPSKDVQELLSALRSDADKIASEFKPYFEPWP